MAQAGDALMGSPSFQPTTLGYAGTPPPAIGGQGQRQRLGLPERQLEVLNREGARYPLSGI